MRPEIRTNQTIVCARRTTDGSEVWVWMGSAAMMQWGLLGDTRGEMKDDGGEMRDGGCPDRSLRDRFYATEPSLPGRQTNYLGT
jgi:hypothetical protein